jgi:hypothetical protein
MLGVIEHAVKSSNACFVFANYEIRVKFEIREDEGVVLEGKCAAVRVLMACMVVIALQVVQQQAGFVRTTHKPKRLRLPSPFFLMTLNQMGGAPSHGRTQQ